MSDFRSQNPYLRQRYGLRERSLPTWVFRAIIFATLGIGWLLWSAFFHSNPPLRTNLISYKTVSNQNISIRFNYSKADPSSNFSCLLTASDQHAIQVGQIVMQLPPAKKGVVKVNIPTSALAASAAIDSCQKR